MSDRMFDRQGCASNVFTVRVNCYPHKLNDSALRSFFLYRWCYNAYRSKNRV